MNGQAHAIVTVVLAVPLTAISPTMAVGCVSGILLSPDLDQENVSHAEWMLVKWTLGLGFVWVALWHPYARLFKHRGVSHWPVLGTLTRLAYLSGLLGVGLILAGWSQWNAPEWVWSGLVWWVAGLMVSDIGHWVLDGRKTR